MGTESHWQERRERGLEGRGALFRRKKPEYVFHTKRQSQEGDRSSKSDKWKIHMKVQMEGEHWRWEGLVEVGSGPLGSFLPCSPPGSFISVNTGMSPPLHLPPSSIPIFSLSPAPLLSLMVIVLAYIKAIPQASYARAWISKPHGNGNCR